VVQTLLLPIEQVFSDLGAIGAGFKLYTYETTTTTPLATYSDTALSVANTNPIIADSAGRFIQTFIGDAKLYKAVLKDADDNTIWTADPIDPKVFSLDDFDPRPTSFWGTTGGTSSAYTLGADPVVSTYSDTQTFFLAFHIANVAAPTLTYVSGGAALNLKKSDGAGGKIDLEANDVLTGTYEARNDGTDIIILNPEKPTKIKLSNGGELTIATGEITITHSRHIVDTESDAATDDLETINGGSANQIIILSNTDPARVVVVKNGVGNIINISGDISLENINQEIYLQYDGSNWVVQNVGQTIQTVNTQTGAVATGSSQIPLDDSIPQNTEGFEVMSLSVTPTSAANNLLIQVVVNCAIDSALTPTIALFQDSTSNALACNTMFNGTNTVTPYVFNHYMAAGTASSTTFKVRIGSSSATTMTFNGFSSARKFGGVLASSITITEIQA